MSKFSLAKDAVEKASSAEHNRTEMLARESRWLAAGIIIVLGFQLLDAKALLESPSPGAKLTGCISVAVLGLALFLTFCSQQTKAYANYLRGCALWDNLKPDSVSEQMAEEALLQMLLKTREQNARQNDTRTRLLYWSRWLLFAGIVLLAVSQLLDAQVSSLG
jgi:hypothetical protein